MSLLINRSAKGVITKRTMKLIPAIDILNGRCAQLVGGVLGTEKYYGNPAEIAKQWVTQGAELLHVVDLDATFGRGDNTTLVRDIKNTAGIPVQFGGGIRTVERAIELLDAGIDRIILGTMVVEEYQNKTGQLEEIVESCGTGRIIAALDSRKGMVVYKGWTKETNIPTTKIINGLEDRVWGFLYTNVDVEGQMKGIDLDAIRRVVNSTEKPVIVSGGVSSNDDIKAIDAAGAWGVVLGKALYEGRIRLRA